MTRMNKARLCDKLAGDGATRMAVADLIEALYVSDIEVLEDEDVDMAFSGLMHEIEDCIDRVPRGES